MRAEEKRRPGEVEHHLHHEQRDPHAAQPRAACVQNHRDGDAEQDVKRGPGDREHPARRSQFGLG
jgi:hypothetical protein